MTHVQPTARPITGRRPHLPALDGLRGVAILGVLVYHTGLLSGGFLGVDLFFALSGYLITDLLLREIEATGAVSLVAFWGRRIRRLLPALATMLVGVTVVVWAVGPPDMVRTTLADGPWVQLNLVNWHLLAESASYWDQFGPVRVFEHLWSIAVEEQFYLVWPVLLLIIARYGRSHVTERAAGVWTDEHGDPCEERARGLRAQEGRCRVQARERRAERGHVIVAVLGSVVSLVLMVLLVSSADPTRVYTGTDTRAFSLLLGAVVATRPVRVLAGRWAGVLLALLAAGVATAWLLVDGANSLWLFTGGLFAHSLASALLIGLVVRAPDALVAKGLAWPPLRWFGLISYSLYLWHWPVFALLPPARGWLWTVAACGVSIGLAALSKYLVEDPVRFRAAWARGRSGTLAFGALMIGLAVLWLALPAPAPTTIDITELD